MNCYINNPKSGAIIPKHLNRNNTLFYPETTMSTYEQHTSGKPRDFHIMTDSPDLVGLYQANEVFLWCPERQEWTHPNTQTYAADLQIIRSECFNIKSSIPRATLDGKTTNCMGHSLISNHTLDDATTS